MTSASPFGPPIPTPRRRKLRTFAFDPMSTRLSGRFLTVSIPFEEGLLPGPYGESVQVVDFDPVREVWYAPIDLNDPYILAQDGLRPNENDPRTHQQIVYAVTMNVLERFERYLGRRFRWRGEDRLRLVPHAFEGRNAFFDPKKRAVLFGYYRADAVNPGANLPGQMIFSCLSSDIIAHEVTHAIVHRLRRRFTEATNADVYAFHEAFADLVTLFQHFAHREVVLEAVTNSSGDLDKGGVLFDLAEEFGQSAGRGKALRSAIDPKADRTPERFRASKEPHERGSIFVAAVFDAYLEQYRANIADLLRIATSGTGKLPEGHLHPDLVNRVTTTAITVADTFLAMVVRAFDYLPPVDVTFGDVVRAIVTSDRALNPDDTLGYRRILVEALRRRGIYPDSVAALTDNSLNWPAPAQPLHLTDGDPRVPLEQLILEETMKLDVTDKTVDVSVVMGGPTPPAAAPADGDGVSGGGGIVRRGGKRAIYKPLQAWAVKHAYELGLQPPGDDDRRPIAVEGMHVSFRQADDRQPRPEIVIQLTQRRKDLEHEYQGDVPEAARIKLLAGTTLVAHMNGEIAYVIRKPLPFDEGFPKEVEAHHKAGEKRFEQMKNYFGTVDLDDPLSVWTDNEPAVLRLDFANLHDDAEFAL